jgi:hypothetical protein
MLKLFLCFAFFTIWFTTIHAVNGTSINCTDSNPCLHGANCTAIESTNQFQCNCLGFYYGSLCENLACENCTHHSQSCVFDIQMPQSYFCYSISCPVHANDTNPCLNNGICLVNLLSDFGYNCLCNAHYRGANCETRKSVCEIANPCLNSGICQTLDNGINATCICQDTWSGTNCTIFTPIVDENDATTSARITWFTTFSLLASLSMLIL